MQWKIREKDKTPIAETMKDFMEDVCLQVWLASLEAEMVLGDCVPGGSDVIDESGNTS